MYVEVCNPDIYIEISDEDIRDEQYSARDLFKCMMTGVSSVANDVICSVISRMVDIGNNMSFKFKAEVSMEKDEEDEDMEILVIKVSKIFNHEGQELEITAKDGEYEFELNHIIEDEPDNEQADINWLEQGLNIDKLNNTNPQEPELYYVETVFDEPGEIVNVGRLFGNIQGLPLNTLYTFKDKFRLRIMFPESDVNKIYPLYLKINEFGRCPIDSKLSDMDFGEIIVKDYALQQIASQFKEVSP